PHGGATHAPAQSHGGGGTAETSQVNPESQHTTDAAERPGAESTAPTAEHPEPAPQAEHYERVHDEPSAPSETSASNEPKPEETP
ncbi:MAG: hypothetical protein GIW95_04085, partial [Candidatus Eremiobacteraeota bacterium]|nr:hypothetical protein [Candidatus Eremiobacteraeota bacterium]